MKKSLKSRIVLAAITGGISSIFNFLTHRQIMLYPQSFVLHEGISAAIAVSLMLLAHFALYLLYREVKRSASLQWFKILQAYWVMFTIVCIAYIIMIIFH